MNSSSLILLITFQNPTLLSNSSQCITVQTQSKYYWLHVRFNSCSFSALPLLRPHCDEVVFLRYKSATMFHVFNWEKKKKIFNACPAPKNKCQNSRHNMQDPPESRSCLSMAPISTPVNLPSGLCMHCIKIVSGPQYSVPLLYLPVFVYLSPST